VKLAGLVAGLVVAHWLHKRLERVETATGVWAVQPPQESPPWADPRWWSSPAFDAEIERWHREQRDDVA